jgi:acyl-CoA synthetase (NDP forming)
MSNESAARGPKAVARFLRPKSVAIVGMSARAGSAGQNVYNSLKINKFAGDIHFVGRSAEPIDGRKVLASPAELPEGVDLAVFCMPAAGVKEAIEDCVKRKVGSALIFAAGFAEAGGRDVQDEVSRTAREGGLAIVGPNCLGFTNNVDGLVMHMLFARPAKKRDPGDPPGVALVGQSGGMLGHMQQAAEARGLPLSYSVSSGNEAGLEAADFVEFLVEDEATRVIVLYTEQIKRPKDFLAACAKARAAGKPVAILQHGRTAKARAAAASHTGSMIGDYGVLRTQMERAGVLMLDKLDDLTDCTELLTRFPQPPSKGGLGILTASGAFVGLMNDFADEMDLEFPDLEPKTLETIQALLPAFGAAGNPLDTTAGMNPDNMPGVMKALANDPNIGMVFVSYPINGPRGPQGLKSFGEGLKGSGRPAIITALGDGSVLSPEILAAAAATGAIFTRSSDRSFRACVPYLRYGQTLERLKSMPTAAPAPFSGLPKLAKGAQVEWLGKKVLAAAGIRVPAGDLAKSADEAVSVAKRVGYPVAMKAQSAALTHKTEAGGVILNLADEKAVREAWTRLNASVAKAAPDVKLDGALIEVMSPKGVELMVGAKRDPAWGPVVLVGLGGIWVEALGDVRILPADATREMIVEALQKLRTAKLLNGFRGTPPVDLDAVAATVQAVGRLMLTVPEIVEVDVNPLVAHAKGQGVTALDALIVTQ